jgi:hypothetical protein
MNWYVLWLWLAGAIPEQIRQGMPFPERFGLNDMRCCA